MYKQEEAVLRKKMLGVLLRYARQHANANLAIREVAARTGLSPGTISDYEFGRRDLSLAQIEIFAHLYHVPVAFFWSDSDLEEEDSDGTLPVEAVMGLRRRIIGVLLRQARIETGRSQEELAELLDCPPTRIANYEFGDVDIPLLELEIMARFLGVPMSYFLDQGIKPTGTQMPDIEELKQLAQLPDDVRRFMLHPGNLLYMRVAMQLSALPASILRRIGEGLLDITY
jgi:transcriptional regulator with XRE-family HTH domain